MSRRACQLLAIWLGVASATPAFTSQAPAEHDDCINDFRDGTDYFPAKAEIEYARGLGVSYHGHYKILTVTRPDRGGAQDAVVLVQCGAPVPALEGELAEAPVIVVPVRTLGANEDLSLNRTRVLGFVDRVVAIGGDGLYSTELRERWETGAAVAIGESFHGQPNYEKLLTAAPDVVFLSTASLDRAESISRARALGLPAVPTMSWIEPSVLGQAEWIYQVAVFFNAEEKANEVLGAIKKRYQELSARARARPERPTVVWLDSAEQRDQWRVPENSWIAELIDDAGGRTPWANPEGAPSRIVTTEQIISAGIGAAAFVTTTAALNERGSAGALESVRAIREGRLYDVHQRSRPMHNAYDWYESAVVEVDRVLEDFVALLHPELLPDHTFRHLRPARKTATGALQPNDP